MHTLQNFFLLSKNISSLFNFIIEVVTERITVITVIIIYVTSIFQARFLFYFTDILGKIKNQVAMVNEIEWIFSRTFNNGA